MTAYTNLGSIGRALGVTFTGSQAVQATAVLDAITAAIDTYTGRSWQGTTGVEETWVAWGNRLFLYQVPVASITSITRRQQTIGGTVTTLAAGTGYELLNAARGEVLVDACPGDLLTVTYDAAGVVPVPVALAATQWAAAVLGPLLQADGSGLAVGPVLAERVGDVEVRYAAPTAQAAADLIKPPVAVQGLLAPFRVPVLA